MVPFFFSSVILYLIMRELSISMCSLCLPFPETPDKLLFLETSPYNPGFSKNIKTEKVLVDTLVHWCSYNNSTNVMQ